VRFLKKNNPEETLENILSISAKLFIEKGFDKTSIQDIINELGMSKGAIYHHFKSKEEILDAVLLKHSYQLEQMLKQWIHDNAASTAREKLIKILENNWGYIEENSLDKVAVSQTNNAQLILGAMKTTIKNSAPIFAKLMYEGKEDGSITTEYPDECSQVFFLLINFWCDPMNFECSLQELINRLKFLQQMMKNMGADIITDELVIKISNSFKYIL
jgi:TetR/AcrR family transcriptional regulator, transcriptional repressor for nem operon